MRHLPIVLLAACAPAVPDAPSYQQHIQPILAANCVRCHGTPVIGGAPETLRLDAYEDYAVLRPGSVEPDVVEGVRTRIQQIVSRVVGEENPMPPRFPLDDYQIETLETWANDPVRGTPRPDNRSPSAFVTELLQDPKADGSGTLVRLSLRVLDPDPDIVGGVLRVKVNEAMVGVGLVRSGFNHIEWDTTGVSPGEHAVDVILDDGAGERSIALGAINVEAP